MKNNKGQALVEFTLILPIILIILLYIIEFGRITIEKYKLEGDLDLIITLYEENKQEQLNDYLMKNNININYTTNNDLITIQIKKNIKSNMPLITKILGDNINTKRVIYNEATEQ